MILKGKRVALMVADRYAERQLWYPYYRLLEAGAEVDLVSANGARCSGRHGIPVEIQRSVDQADPTRFDALIIPGGDDADLTRRLPQVVTFVRTLAERGALVAAIGEGALLLAAAGVAAGRRVTGPPPIRDVLRTVGAIWVDQEVVSDGNVITSRVAEDLPAFCRAITDTLR